MVATENCTISSLRQNDEIVKPAAHGWTSPGASTNINPRTPPGSRHWAGAPAKVPPPQMAAGRKETNMANLLSYLSLTFVMISPGEKPVLLISVRDWVDFDSKQRQGTSYEILCHALGYEKITVKVRDTVSAITAEQLDALARTGRTPFVTFTGFQGKLYQDFRSPNRDVKLSATAEGIRLIEEEGKK